MNKSPLIYLFWLVPFFSYGDVVVMKNGDRLSGVVDSLVKDELLIELKYAGIVSLKLEEVATITTNSIYEVQMLDTKLEGRLQVDSGTQYLRVGDQRIPVSIEEIEQLVKKRNALIPLTNDWRTRADLSLIVSEGNSETNNYNVFIESILKRPQSEHALALLINNEKAEEILTREQFDLDYGYKRFISEKWFASATAEYFEDELKGVERRLAGSGGIGYQFWDNSIGELSADISLSAVQEKIGLENEMNPALRLGIDFRRLFFINKMEVFHRQSILSIPDSARGQVLNASTGLRYELSTFVDTAFRIDTNYETKPAPGRQKTDLTYTIGLGLKF